MDSSKKHGNPLDEELQKPLRGADVVSDNDPGSKGDVRSDGEFVRSASQKPNPDHPSDDATMGPGGDLGQKRNTL